ncbi:hypothetical protein Poli38472_011625 [Pythium oligandrum]|uniref:Uncharacterized protein n=1 Tax=Pythium oligandrum TaxID=41045 RepID=A0A8K1CLA9_PYTOL|nr:hypothetical protein Poli38472_011625 [Pythium oligandrum]|eukprot:TMW64745.1 hypothetical protein Poli38472_011625 [Pythium oligandrum]
MIAALYQAHLVVKTARATYDFINSDVANLPHQLIPEFELFMEAVLRANSPRLPRPPPDAVTDRIVFIFNTALSTLSCSVEKNTAGTGLLLCCATLGVVDKSSPSVKRLVNFAIQRVCGQSEVLHSLDPTSGVVITLSLRCLQRCIIQGASDDVFCVIENHIQSISASLLLSTVFQRETIKLLYRLRHPQEMIYTSLVEAQEFAFLSDQNLRSFVSVLGIVAAENAKFIAAQTSSDSHGYDNEILEDIDAEDKQENYLKDFKYALARRNRIKHANEELISQGLLSAYLPLVDKSLQKSRDIRLQVAAILTLGEFMKLSPKTTNEYFGRVLQFATDTGIPKSVRIACIDVWASLQPLLAPSETKDNGVVAIYTIIGTSIQAKQDTCAVSCHALKKLLFLILHGQVRDDRLVSICVFLPSAGDDRKVIVESFFQQYLRRCTPNKVSRLFFDVYFSLVSAQDDTRDASLSVLTELINLAKDGSIKLEMLQTTLVSEIESKPRRVDSLRLLSQFPVIPAAALSKLTELVQRGVVGDDELEARSILIHLMSGQLQRCKDTLAKKKIQLAIQQLKASDATPRLHVDAEMDTQSIGKFLSEFQFE